MLGHWISRSIYKPTFRSFPTAEIFFGGTTKQK